MATLNVVTMAENKHSTVMAAPARMLSRQCSFQSPFTHAVKQDATHLLFTVVAHSILQMCNTNCGNDNQVLKIENKNENENENQFFEDHFTSLIADPSIAEMPSRQFNSTAVWLCCQTFQGTL